MKPHSWKEIVNLTVVVGALGYFVDIFDLILFPIIRTQSLSALGVPKEQILPTFLHLFNYQMTGMLVGGLLWGILGDKKGRMSVLFGSITLYSLANIANAFVTTIPAYAAMRFIAGVGLSGELGAAITLVSEVLPKELRSYGTAVVASVGITGALVANFVGKIMPWNYAFITGGVLGLLLLLLRIKVTDSGMFKEIQHAAVTKGDFLSLFTDWRRFSRYLRSILIGVPIWYVVAILVASSPELAKGLGVVGAVNPGDAVACCYLGLAIGDLGSGFISQWIASRKKTVLLFQGLTLVMVLVVLFSRGVSAQAYYLMCIALGFAAGYWAVFVTIASEQFGTNVRATATTTVPNFVRGMVVPLSMSFTALKGPLGPLGSAGLVGALTLVVAFAGLAGLDETFGKDLDHLEE
jgi:predicted MFS family arabinose efflux permease